MRGYKLPEQLLPCMREPIITPPRTPPVLGIRRCRFLLGQDPTLISEVLTTMSCFTHGLHTNQQITQWLGSLSQIPAWGSMLRRLKGSVEAHSNTQEPACYGGSR